MVRKVEVEIETSQVAPFLFLHLINFELGKKHAALWMIRMWQRLETGRKQVPFFDLLRAQFRELVPGRAAGEFDSHTLLHGFSSRHFDSLSRAIAQIIALLKQSHLPLHDLWLSRGHA